MERHHFPPLFDLLISSPQNLLFLIHTNSKMETPKDSFKSPKHQYFSLPFFVISYLIDASPSPGILLKLQQTCKYLFIKKRILIATPKIKGSENGVFYSESTGLVLPFQKDTGIGGRPKYWFTNLDYHDCDGLAILRPHIYRLSLIELMITSQNLTLKDINFLLTNKQMKKLCLCFVEIRDTDIARGDPVPIDYILRKVPSLTEFRYGNLCEIYSNSLLMNLNSIQFFSKFQIFALIMSQTSEQIEAEILGKFIEMNLAASGEVEFGFPPNTPELETIKSKLQQIVDNWTPLPDGKPRCGVCEI